MSEFLASECRRQSIGGARGLVAKLRPLLVYLHVTGVISTPLRWAVPGVADLQGRSLPRALEPAAVTSLLASRDRRRTVGRRNYAILLLLLVRLGLRASEVAAIRLEDIDWRAGETLVRGKGGRRDRLPLPTDVGEALAAYLQHRPRTESRAVFTLLATVVAPAGENATNRSPPARSSRASAAAIAWRLHHRPPLRRRRGARTRTGSAPGGGRLRSELSTSA